MLRPLPDGQVQHFYNDASQHESDQKSLYLIPCPGTESLRRKLESTLLQEAVVVQANAHPLADQQQQQQVQEKRQRIVLKSQAVCQVTQPARPPCDQQNNQKSEPHYKIGNAQPAPDAIVATRLRRIELNRIGIFYHAITSHYFSRSFRRCLVTRSLTPARKPHCKAVTAAPSRTRETTTTLPRPSRWSAHQERTSLHRDALS